jgi:hypothetical protein
MKAVFERTYRNIVLGIDEKTIGPGKRIRLLNPKRSLQLVSSFL